MVSIAGLRAIIPGKKLLMYYARPLTWRTLLCRWRGRSDKSRWAAPTSLSPNWDERTVALGRLIQADSSVLEFGAGRMILKQHRPTGCRYTPSDIVDRGPGTLVVDLNATELPEFPSHDVAVFSGVLEYVHDVPRLIRQVKLSCPTVVTSYVPVTDSTALASAQRLSRGWVNAYSSAEFRSLFESAGYSCSQQIDFGNQMLYRFEACTSGEQPIG